MRLILQYIGNMIPYCLLGFFLCLGCRFINCYKHPKKDWKRELVICVFAAYCAGLASQTIMPHWNCGIDMSGKLYIDTFWDNELASVNLIPFKTILGQLSGNNSIVGEADIHKVSVLNLLANLLLFSPIGLFLPLLWKKFRKIKNVILAGVLVSTSVEMIQFFIGRSSDIDDVFLNTLGVCVGYGLYKIITKLKKIRILGTA